MQAMNPIERTRIRRHAERGVYELAQIYSILDEGYICYLGFVADFSQDVELELKSGSDPGNLRLVAFVQGGRSRQSAWGSHATAEGVGAHACWN